MDRALQRQAQVDTGDRHQKMGEERGTKTLALCILQLEDLG
jgi:hypothetical protein